MAKASALVREVAQSGDLSALFAADALAWAVLGKVKLQSGKTFQTIGHEYQRDIMQCDHPNQCAKKGAQVGVTEINVLKTIHLWKVPDWDAIFISYLERRE